MLSHIKNAIIALAFGIIMGTWQFFHVYMLGWDGWFFACLLYFILSFAVMLLARFLRKFNFNSQKHLIILSLVLGIAINIVINRFTFKQIQSPSKYRDKLLSGCGNSSGSFWCIGAMSTSYGFPIKVIGQHIFTFNLLNILIWSVIVLLILNGIKYFKKIG